MYESSFRYEVMARFFRRLHSQLSAEIKKAAPRNLLDNSDFANPVNQRGFKSGSSVSSGYPIDRWRTSGTATITLSKDGITLTGNMFQYVEASRLKEGVKYTLACKMDGEIICYVFTAGAGGGSWDGGLTVSYSANSGKYQVYITKANVVYEWVALYEGEYTEDTLPEYQPKGYGAELAECMRYFYRFDTSINGVYIPCMANSTQIPGFLFPVPMITAPTITIESLQTWTNAGITDVSDSISSQRCRSGGLQYIELISSAKPTVNGLITMTANFSADL